MTSIFPNGTAFADWIGRNCDRCKKGPPPGHTGHNAACAIEDAIALASCFDGTLESACECPEKAASIAARLKWDRATYLETDCPEIDPETAPKP